MGVVQEQHLFRWMHWGHSIVLVFEVMLLRQIKYLVRWLDGRHWAGWMEWILQVGAMFLNMLGSLFHFRVAQSLVA